jgi:hypothetical protein
LKIDFVLNIFIFRKPNQVKKISKPFTAWIK